jgi:hypothetical protein
MEQELAKNAVAISNINVFLIIIIKIFALDNIRKNLTKRLYGPNFFHDLRQTALLQYPVYILKKLTQ